MPGRTVHLRKAKGVHGLSRNTDITSECLPGDIQNWKSFLRVLPSVLVGRCVPGPFPGGRQPWPDPVPCWCLLRLEGGSGQLATEFTQDLVQL